MSNVWYMPKKSTTEEFVKKAKAVHGDKYDYSLARYEGNEVLICIICPIHGVFWQRPSVHKKGCGCPECAKEAETLRKRDTRESFIAKAEAVHGVGRYDYSEANYIDSKTEVKIICLIHGAFWQRPSVHLQGHGCPQCAIENNPRCQPDTRESFIAKAEKVHGKGKYDYSRVIYINNHTKVEIICPMHGSFWQTPYNHIYGNQGCPHCYGTPKKTKEQFVRDAEQVHGVGTYDYSRAIYDGNKEPLEIICHKKDKNGVEHGSFWQRPVNHIAGRQGCPKCSQSHMECEANAFLSKMGVTFKAQKTFPWLGSLRLDFYIKDFNIAIECQGQQHFEPVDFFGGEEAFKERVERDQRKKRLCEENGVPLFYVRYDENVEERLRQILAEFTDTTTYEEMVSHETTLPEEQRKAKESKTQADAKEVLCTSAVRDVKP